MRAVLLEVPESLLAERRRTGADRFDEVWEGVLHMVPAPSAWHQRFGTLLLRVLAPIAETKGLVAAYETNHARPGAGAKDYRVPDLIFARSELWTSFGVEGPAELVIELLSPGDETHDKLSFYESLGVHEALVIDPETRRTELFLLRGARLLPAVADASGALRSEVLGVAFTAREGPRLELAWSGGSATI